MSFFSSITQAVSLVFDSSSAAMTAKDVYSNGGTIREAITTFASETDNSVDDKIVEEICDWVELGIDSLYSLSQHLGTAIEVSEKLSPIVADKLRLASNIIEIRGPDTIASLRGFARKATELAELLEREGGPDADSNDNANK